MTDVDTLVQSHTREELDQIASEAGVEDPQALDTKADVAEAIVAAEGPQNNQSPEADAPQASTESGLPEGWQLVQAGPDYFTAERYVESLGLQKVSEGAETIEALAAACEAYDEHQAGLAEGWPNTATAVTGVAGTNQ